YDYVDAYHHFADPEWDGEPLEPEVCITCGEERCQCIKGGEKKLCWVCKQQPCICIKEPKPECLVCGQSPCVCKKKVKVKLKNGKELEIKHMISTSFWTADGVPVSAEEFLNNLFGALPDFFKSEEELRLLWSNPLTRRSLLTKLADAGFGKDELHTLQSLIDAEKSDIFDVLEYVFNSEVKPISREER